MQVYQSVEALTEANFRSGMEVEYAQVGKGTYYGYFPTKTNGRCTFIKEAGSVAVVAHGEVSESTYIVAGSNDDVRLNGSPIQTDRLIVYPPGSEMFGASRGAYRISQVCIPKTLVDDYLNAAALGAAKWCRSEPHRFTVTPSFSKWFHAAVELLAQKEDGDDALAHDVEVRLLDMLVKAETGLANYETGRRGRPFSLYGIEIMQVLEFIHGNLRSLNELDELCLATKIPLRTLQRMFERCFGLPPKKYIMMCKLNAIRSELMNASYSEATVSEIALKYHMSHLGRFSVLYREVFQEYPRETLARETSGRVWPGRRTALP